MPPANGNVVPPGTNTLANTNARNPANLQIDAEWLQNYELGNSVTPIRRPSSRLAYTPRTPANISMNDTAFNATNASAFIETPLNFNVPLVASRLNREARINAEVAKRKEELEDKAEVERRLKEAIEMSNLEKERRKAEEERNRIELHEEELRRANERAETSDGYD